MSASFNFVICGFVASQVLSFSETIKIAMEDGDIAPSSEMAKRKDELHEKIKHGLQEINTSERQIKNDSEEIQFTIAYWGSHGLKITFFGLLEKEAMINAVVNSLTKIKASNVNKICFEFYERQETRKVRNPWDKFTSVETFPVNLISRFEWNIRK